MPYEPDARKEKADECYGMPFSAQRCADARAWIRKHGDAAKLASNEHVDTITIKDLRLEFGADVFDRSAAPKGLNEKDELRDYELNGAVPARKAGQRGWTWDNSGALDQVRCLIFRKYVLKEPFAKKSMKVMETTKLHKDKRKSKDPNAPRRKIVRKGVKEGEELDKGAEKIRLRKERDERNARKFEDAKEEAHEEHQKQKFPFYQPRPHEEIANGEVRYKFISDNHWELPAKDPWKGCSVHGVVSLGQGVFGKIFLAWRFPASGHDPDGVVDKSIVAVKISKNYSKPGGEPGRDKVEREAKNVSLVSQKINGDTLPEAMFEEKRKQKRAELLEKEPNAESWTSRERKNEIFHLVPRPDSYFFASLLQNEIFWHGLYNVQIYERCDMDLLGAMKKYTSVIRDDANSRGWKTHIANGTAKVNIFGSRGMKRDGNGEKQGFHPFSSWEEELWDGNGPIRIFSSGFKAVSTHHLHISYR